MERYDCHGWLHITLEPSNSVALIKIKHEMCHEAYLDIELPEEWKTYVEKNAGSKTPGQVRNPSA